MCGILAVLNFNNKVLDKELLIRMRDTMYHRGPNDAGLYVEGPVGLAHRRLSIIDLSEKGHQPMFNEDKTIVLVCNGEIYNYVELGEDLKKKGHKFYSSSDSEVIIHQYEEDGEQCLDKFNGMFSFVLWDNKSKRLFAARDRLGIKPLYYFLDKERIIFASEIKAIIEDPTISRIPNYHAIADYLFAGRALGSKTIFQNIKEVEPGYTLCVEKESGNVKTKKYWDVQFDYNYSRQLDDVKEEMFYLLNDSVKIHCRSDAPLGCHLSGGLDSSTIVAFASRHKHNLKTFTVKFSDEAYIDETKYAKKVAKHVRADYIEGTPSVTDMSRLIPFLLWHMEMPMISDGALGYYFVNQFAHKEVKVTLTGHGGDEVFAGYPAQFSASYNTTEMFGKYGAAGDPYRVLYKNIRSSVKSRIIKGLLHKNYYNTYKSIKKKIFKGEKSFEDKWVQLHCGAMPEDSDILHKDFVRLLHDYSPRDEYLEPFKEVNTDQTLDKCLYHDLRVYLPALLHLEDRASMAVSLESRIPLLDYRIIEFLSTVPPEQKVNGLQPKYLLRDIAASLLPEQVWRRKDKRGFPVPGKLWFTKEMKDLKAKILLSPESKNRGVFNHRALEDACNNVDAWPLLNVELWFKIFIDRDPYWISMTKL